MELDYLDLDSKFINKEELLKLYEERSTWKERKSNNKYKEVFDSLPNIKAQNLDLDTPVVRIGNSDEISDDQRSKIHQDLEKLIPWRKGPFNLFGIDIDAEWRSDFKWERIKHAVGELEGKKVLDIGCNNGYFMFRMAQENPELVLGIDPMYHNLAQFEYLNHYAGLSNLKFELFGIEHLNMFRNYWDTIFSMGILYHHRHPLEQLIDMRESLAPSGTMILETIGIPGEGSYSLFPEDRYAGMRNVWFLPTLECLTNWIKRAGFIDVEVISEAPTTLDEQRRSKWCPPPYKSLKEFLDPEDLSKTMEGHPAPVRFCLKAKKKETPLLGVMDP